MSDNEHEDPPGVDAGVVQQLPVEQQEILQFAHCKFSGISSGQIFHSSRTSDRNGFKYSKYFTRQPVLTNKVTRTKLTR